MFDGTGILDFGELRGQLFEARFVRIETANLLDRLPGIVQHPGFDGGRGTKQTAFDPPPPHPHLEALPLLRSSVGLQHGEEGCKLRVGCQAERLFLLLVVHFVVFCGDGDVVDVDFLVLDAPVLVGIVETADRTLLDGAAWTAVAVLALRLALVLWRRVRTEVAVALTGRRSAGLSPCRRRQSTERRLRTRVSAEREGGEASRSARRSDVEVEFPGGLIAQSLIRGVMQVFAAHEPGDGDVSW